MCCSNGTMHIHITIYIYHMIRFTEQAEQQITTMLNEAGLSGWGIVLSVTDIHCAGLHYDIDFAGSLPKQHCILESTSFPCYTLKDFSGFFEDVLIDWVEGGVSTGLVVINAIEQAIPGKACASIHGCGCSAMEKIEGSTACVKC